MDSRLRITWLRLKIQQHLHLLHQLHQQNKNLMTLNDLKIIIDSIKKIHIEKKEFEIEIVEREEIFIAMKNLNIKIYCSSNKIELKFEIRSCFPSIYLKEYLPIFYYQDSIDSVSEEKISQDEYSYSISFQLPSSPHLILSWLSYMNSYFSGLNTLNLKKVSISCENQDSILFLSWLSHAYQYLSQIDLFSISLLNSYVDQKSLLCKNHLLSLVNGILSLESNNQASYKNIFPLLNKLKNNLVADENFNMDLFFFKYALYDYSLSSNIQENDNLTSDKDKRIKSLCKLSRDLIASEQKKNLNAYFDRIDLYVKSRLYDSCLNKCSSINDKYTLSDPRWFFLQSAKFKLINKKICIEDIQNNPAYQAFYAAGSICYQNYERDVVSLIKDLGLDIEINLDNDLHSCIHFTNESNKKLLSLGFCLKDECQREIYKQNNLRLFSTSHKDNKEKRSPLYSCPKEVIDKIFDEVYSSNTLRR